LVSVSE
jgi:hypothetical protein